jgi:hypothetical protein
MFPAVLIALLTRLGYHWYPEYMVYEDYREFNQEQYHADVRIYDQQDDSDTELHLFHGIGVTIEMAVHDAAYSAVACLRGEHSISLDASEFRYILYAPAGDATGYYTTICAPYEHHRYNPQVLIQCTQALDRTVRALAVELFATRARLYDAMTQLLLAIRAGIHPEHILHPRRTQMYAGIDWPAVGGHTSARGPLLPARDRILHQSAHGEQDFSAMNIRRPHLQLPRFSGSSQR